MMREHSLHRKQRPVIVALNARSEVTNIVSRSAKWNCAIFKESRQCHPHPSYGILHFDYHPDCSIFFFCEHDSGKRRDFAFKIDLESSYLLYSHCCFGDWYSGNSTEVFR